MSKKIKYLVGIVLVGALLLGAQYYFSLRPSAFRIDCGMPISEKVCFVDKLDQEACGEIETKFQWIFGELEKIYAISPPLVQLKLCNINHINIVKWPGEDFGEAGSSATYNSVSLSWNFLKATQNTYEDFLFFRALAYRQNNQFIIVSDSEELKISVDYTGQHRNSLNFGLAGTLFHEIAHLIDGNDLVVDGFHCVYDLPETREQIEKSNINLRQVSTSESYCTQEFPLDADSSIFGRSAEAGFATLYASCRPGEDFAETFSEYILDVHLGVRMSITKNEELLLNQHEQLLGPNLAAKIHTIEALLAYPLDSSASLSNIGLAHLMCEGPFDVHQSVARNNR